MKKDKSFRGLTKAEARAKRDRLYRNGTQLVGSGEAASVAGGSSGFNNARQDAIVLTPVEGGAGPGPKKTIDVAAGAKCSAFKPFGTWSITLP